MTVAIAKPTRRQRVRAEIRRALMGQGFSEALTDTFVSGQGELGSFGVAGDSPLRLAARNPVNAALPALRRNLMGSLLNALCTNERQGIKGPRLFEVANVFAPSPDGQSTGERGAVGLLAPGSWMPRALWKPCWNRCASRRHWPLCPFRTRRSGPDVRRG